MSRVHANSPFLMVFWQLAVEKEISARQLAGSRQNCEHLAQDLQENVERRMEMEQDRAAEAQVRC